MERSLKNKRGSSTVFLCVIISGLMMVSLAMVYSAHERAVNSCADSVLRLGSDSVMSEFDYYVQQEYGLFLLQGNDEQLSRKLRGYTSYSLDAFKGVNIDKCKSSAGRFNAIDVDSIEDQIIRYVKTVGVVDKVKEKLAEGSGGGTGESNSNGTGGQSAGQGHTLRHGPTIVSLPSKLLPGKSIVQMAEGAASGLKDPSRVFKKGTRNYMLDSYILSHFNSDTTKPADDHFFNNEVEYILAGKMSDDDNVKKTDLALKAIRFPTNLAHIYSDPEKWSAVVAAAETITPGLLGTVTQAGIAAAWATAESFNDAKLLHAGYRVPIVKDAASWAIDIDGLLKKKTDKMFKPDVNKGQTYKDYMRILLFIEDNDIKTARILDLIQINMRKNYDSDFLIPECSYGIAVDAAINGNRYLYDKTY